MYTVDQRMEIVGAIKYVDEVISYSQVVDDIKNIDFDVFVRGGDQNHKGLMAATEWCERNGKEVVIISRTPGICSSDIKRSLEIK